MIHFSTTSNIAVSVNRSNFTFVFFKNPCYDNPGEVQKRAGSCSFFKIHNQIHQLTITYRFPHTNHGIHLNFKIFTNLFCVRIICIINIFHV